MEEMGRAQPMPMESCLHARTRGTHEQPWVKLQMRGGTFLTQHLNYHWSVPACLSKASSSCPWPCKSLQVPWKAVLNSSIGEWGAGVCWSEQGAIATSIGPARRPEELLWVL